ncbi:type II toxin-antitoxin system RelE family toxin [Dermabacteraceae bacterium CCM 9519]
MTEWSLYPTKRFEKALSKIAKRDRNTAQRIVSALESIRSLDDPTVRCKALTGTLSGLWRLRVGDWRVVLDIDSGKLVVIALDVDHRSSIYR